MSASASSKVVDTIAHEFFGIADRAEALQFLQDVADLTYRLSHELPGEREGDE